MAFPINIIGMDLSPLVIDDDYEVVDKQQLAEWIAIMMLGQYAHIYMIIEKLSPAELPSNNALIDYMLSKLNVPKDNDTLIEHRDGWLFQMMSWIALNIKLHAEYPGCTIHMGKRPNLGAGLIWLRYNIFLILRKILFIKVKRNMEIKDYVKQFRDLQKSHKKVRVADFCRENMLDYYEMVEALKQEKFEVESYEEQVHCGDLVITEIPESNNPPQPNPSTESYIKEVMLSFPKGLKLTVREITPSDLITIVQRLMPIRNYA